jgi:hypothetical protein
MHLPSGVVLLQSPVGRPTTECIDADAVNDENHTCYDRRAHNAKHGDGLDEQGTAIERSSRLKHDTKLYQINRWGHRCKLLIL